MESNSASPAGKTEPVTALIETCILYYDVFQKGSARKYTVLLLFIFFAGQETMGHKSPRTTHVFDTGSSQVSLLESHSCRLSVSKTLNISSKLKQFFFYGGSCLIFTTFYDVCHVTIAKSLFYVKISKNHWLIFRKKWTDFDHSTVSYFTLKMAIIFRTFSIFNFLASRAITDDFCDTYIGRYSV